MGEENIDSFSKHFTNPINLISDLNKHFTLKAEQMLTLIKNSK